MKFFNPRIFSWKVTYEVILAIYSLCVIYTSVIWMSFSRTLYNDSTKSKIDSRHDHDDDDCCSLLNTDKAKDVKVVHPAQPQATATQKNFHVKQMMT